MYEKKLVLCFIRVHVLHHAASPEGTYGLWMIEELARHGYQASPGTVYPILKEMEAAGLLRSERELVSGRYRRVYRATAAGRELLERLRGKVRELYEEVSC